MLGNHNTSNTPEKIKRKNEQVEQDALIAKEEVDTFRTTINRLFSSDDGKYFLNQLKLACGVNSFDKDINPAKLIEDAGRRKIWLKLIHRHLDTTILRELDQ